MNRILQIFTLVFAGLFFICSVREFQAQIVTVGGVGYDTQTEITAGFAGTYVDYYLLDYYDPWVKGKLAYENPYQQIDQEQGEGVNDVIYPFFGHLVEFTTNDYRPNRLLCTYTDHRVRLFEGPPLLTGWQDPYQIDLMTPFYHVGTEYYLNISSSFT